jgi:uncharacterized membrane protein
MTKTISFGLMHLTVAFGVAYALTGSLVVGGAIALVEPAINTVAYFFHERLWERLRARRGEPTRDVAPAPCLSQRLVC